MKQTLVLVCTIMALAVGCAPDPQASTTKSFKVEIGESVADAKKASSHDLSWTALERGKTEFKVEASGQQHKIKLSEEQVENLLKGSTVMLQTTGSRQLAVKISVDEKKEKKSGW